MKKFFSFLFASLLVFSAFGSNKKNFYHQKVQNLIAFSKAYGYTRYFHPIEGGNKINWNLFLQRSIPQIISCKSNNELIDSLTKLFTPISPFLRFLLHKPFRTINQIYKPTDTLVFHQYRGIKTSQLQYLSFIDYNVKILNNKFIDSSLFNIIPNYNRTFYGQLVPGVFIDFPIVTKYSDYNKFNRDLINQKASFYSSQCSNIQIKNLADIIAFWNIIQHFYPYHIESKMDWEQTLKTTIEAALKDSLDNNSEKYIFMLGKEMKDGHFRIMSYLYQSYYLPINIRIQNSFPIVIESLDTTLFKIGDVLQTINHKNVSALIDSVSNFWSGSDGYVNYWCGNEIHRSYKPDEVTVELLRGNKKISLKAKRGNFKHPLKSKFLGNGIFYINLSDKNCNMDTIISIASKSNALILDWRNGSDLLQVHKLFQHLTDDTLAPSLKYLMPQIVYPDHKTNSFFEPKQDLPPLKPRLKIKVVILSGPSNISYQESIIKMAQEHNLATIIGETTGGANGSINYSTLPSGMIVSWTGMKVVNLDGSQYHLKGIKPNVLVAHTLDGLKNGKDEVLEKALEVLNQKNF